MCIILVEIMSDMVEKMSEGLTGLRPSRKRKLVYEKLPGLLDSPGLNYELVYTNYCILNAILQVFTIKLQPCQNTGSCLLVPYFNSSFLGLLGLSG